MKLHSLLRVSALALLVAHPVLAAAQVRVASLHPLLTDLAAQVGGERVSVSGIVTVKDDPHAFQPTASDLKSLASARLILASGKGLESYLPKVRDNLRDGQTLLEVGKNVPSIKIEAGELFACCPEHSSGSIDPHWWHSADNMKRAAGIVAEALTEIDPAGKSAYKANAKAYGGKLDGLKRWAKEQFAGIPRGERKLVTAHAAFGYFCKEYGFQSVPVRGLTPEREPSSKYLAETIALLRDEKVRAVFPEAGANPKVLEEMTRSTGAKLGGRLIADGTGSPEGASFERMLRHNVTTIAAALRP